MGILWNCLGSSQGEWHGIVLSAIHWAVAHMHVMELRWCFTWGMTRTCSMGTSVGCHHGHPMELHWEFSMRIPLTCSMGNALGCPPWAFYGIAWGVPKGNGMALF